MLGGREDADERLEDRVKAALRLRRRELLDRGLLADDPLELRDEVDEELAAAPERAAERRAPARELLRSLGEDVPEQLPEGARERGVRRPAVQLLELARGEVAASLGDGPVHLVHQGRLAHARVPRHEQELALPAGGALEGGEQRARLLGAAVELLRDAQRIRDVAQAEREGRHRAGGRDLAEARVEVGEEPEGALVPVLRVLLEELHDDPGHRVGHARDLLGRRHAASARCGHG